MSESSIIVELKLYEKGKLRALGDVLFPTGLGELAIRGFRVIQDGEEAPWVGFPSASYVKDGQTVRSPLLQLGPGLRRRVVEAVLAQYERQRG